MEKQVKPQAIVDRIEALVKEQIAKNFKPGWVSYCLKELCQQKATNLIIYHWHGHDCYIGYLGFQYADGRMSLQDVKENLQALYEQEKATAQQFGQWVE